MFIVLRKEGECFDRVSVNDTRFNVVLDQVTIRYTRPASRCGGLAGT